MIDPPNTVGYLIVDDDGRRKHKRKPLLFFGSNSDADTDTDTDTNDYEYEEEGEDPFWAETGATDEASILWEEIDAMEDQAIEATNNINININDDEPAPPSSKSLFVEEKPSAAAADMEGVNDDEPAPVKYSEAYLTRDDEDGSGDDLPMPVSLKMEEYRVKVASSSGEVDEEDDELYEGHRVLRRHHNSNIKVAILHVAYREGFELFNAVLKEQSSIRQAGGSKILLNGKSPSASAKTIFLWALLSVAICGGACCCLLLCVSHGIMFDEEQAPARVPPVRRRLTHQQVRDNHPAFHYDPETHVEQQLEECAICLDEFEPGCRCRQLPCQHVFHSACIGRWMIERSATCPLCKVDLYEEEEEESSDSDSGSPTEAAEPPSAQSLLRWWAMASRTTTTPATSADQPNTTADAPTPTTANTNTASLAPTRSWWPFSMATTTTATSGSLADQTETEGSPSRWRPNWFGRDRQRRRPTEGGMLMSELTEPFLAGESSSQPPLSLPQEEPSHPPAEEAATPPRPAEPSHEATPRPTRTPPSAAFTTATTTTSEEATEEPCSSTQAEV
jgi:hypothetical protein